MRLEACYKSSWNPLQKAGQREKTRSLRLYSLKDKQTKESDVRWLQYRVVLLSVLLIIFELDTLRSSESKQKA